jgi:hypothetical protein
LKENVPKLPVVVSIVWKEKNIIWEQLENTLNELDGDRLTHFHMLNTCRNSPKAFEPPQLKENDRSGFAKVIRQQQVTSSAVYHVSQATSAIES